MSFPPPRALPNWRACVRWACGNVGCPLPALLHHHRGCDRLRPPIGIYGTDYPTPDGTCIRDCVHVADLAAAQVLTLKRLLAGGENLALNLGFRRGFSGREIIMKAMSVTGLSVPTREQDGRPGDLPILVADSTAARRVLRGPTISATPLIG